MALSIRRKLILLFIITCVLPMFILGGFTYNETYKALGVSEQKRMEEQISNITNSINIALEDTENMAQSLAATPSLNSLLSDYNTTGAIDVTTKNNVEQSLRKIYVDAGGIYENMLVVGRNGTILVDSWNGKYTGQRVSSEECFRNALQNKTFVIGQVSASSLSKTKVKLPVISMAYPVLTSGGTALGAIIITYDLNFFNRHIYKAAPGNSGFGYMFDQTGTVLYHPNSDLLMKPVNIPAAREISNRIKLDMSGNYKGNGTTTIHDRNYLYYYQIVPKSKWIVATFIPHSQLFAVADRLRFITVAILVIVGLISLPSISYLVRSIDKALAEMKALLNKVEFNDYSCRCTVKSGDEFEDLGNSFNQMLENQSTYVKKLCITAEKSETVSRKLNEVVEKINHDMDAISSATLEVSAGAGNNDNSMQELKGAIGQLSEESKKIRLASGHAVQLASNAVKSANDGGRTVSDTVKSIADIEKSIKESSRSVRELYQAMDSINSFVNIIKQLASETNLIAINAAIQAANSGEHGRTFEVVAGKIKALAKASDEAALNISGIIKNIKTREDTLILDMKLVEEHVKTGLVKAEHTVNSFKRITEEVSQNKDFIKNILSSIEEQAAAMEEVTKNMEIISQTTANTTEGTTFIAENINHQSTILGEISETSRELKAAAQDLFEMVSTIKL